MTTILYLSNQLVQAVKMKGKKVSHVCQEKAPEGSIINGIITDEEVFLDWIGRFFFKNRLSKKKCQLVINSTQIHMRVLKLPKTGNIELLNMIAREYSDIRTEKTVFTYQVLENDPHDKMQRILAMAVEKDFIISYLRLFAQAGIEVTTVESAITRFIHRFSNHSEIQTNNCIVQILDGADLISMLFVKGVYLYSQKNRIFNVTDESILINEAEAVLGRLQQFATSQQIEDPISTVFLCGQNQKQLKETLEDSRNLSTQLSLKLYTEPKIKLPKRVDFIYPITGMAKQDKKQNFVRYMKKDSIEAAKRKGKALLFLPVICVLTVCLLITAYLGGRWLLTSNEVSQLQKTMENPEAVSAHTAYELAELNVGVMEKKMEQAKILWNHLMSYPTINTDIRNILSECAGDKISIELKSFNRDSGVISISATANRVTEINGFIQNMQEQTIFEAVEYSGYIYMKEQDCYKIHVVCTLAAEAGRQRG